MKDKIFKITKIFFSRSFWLVLGIFFAISVTYVFASWNDAKTGGSGQMTENNWNSMVDALEVMDSKVDALGSSGGIYETSCAWRYDHREGVQSTGEASNWSCNPPACASGYTSLTVNHEPSGVSCSGSNFCNFDNPDNDNHPVVVGRSVRVCAPN
jgi:hypothetical protein